MRTSSQPRGPSAESTRTGFPTSISSRRLLVIIMETPTSSPRAIRRCHSSREFTSTGARTHSIKAPASEGGRYKGGSNPRRRGKPLPYKVRVVTENCGLDGFSLGVGWFGIGGEGIEAEEFGIVVKESEVGIAPGPNGILEAGFPGFFDRFEGFTFAFENGVGASGVVKDGGLVGAESDGHVQFANGVINAAKFRVIGGHEDAGTGVFGYLLQVVFEGADAAEQEIAVSVFFAEGAERVGDGNVDVVILAADFESSFHYVDHFLVAAGGKQRAAEEIVGAFAVALALDGFFDHAHSFVVKFGGVKHPSLADHYFRQIPAQGNGFAGSVASALHPNGVAAVIAIEHRAGIGAG